MIDDLALQRLERDVGSVLERLPTPRGCACSATARYPLCWGGRPTSRAGPASGFRRFLRRLPQIVTRPSSGDTSTKSGAAASTCSRPRSVGSRFPRAGLRSIASSPCCRVTRSPLRSQRSAATKSPRCSATSSTPRSPLSTSASGWTPNSRTGRSATVGSPTSTSRPRCCAWATDRRTSTLRCSSLRCPGYCAQECDVSSSPEFSSRYHDRRTVILDLAANLTKERLESWIPTVLEAVGDRLEPPLTVEEVRRDYRSDARPGSSCRQYAAPIVPGSEGSAAVRTRSSCLIRSSASCTCECECGSIGIVPSVTARAE